MVMRKIKFTLAFLSVCVFIALACPVKTAASAENYGKTNRVYNTVIFLTFSSEDNAFPENFYSDMRMMYESASTSVANYFKKQSLGALQVETTFLFSDGECVRSDEKENYYKPRYSWRGTLGSYSYVEINPEGYDNRWFDKDGTPVEPSEKGAKQSVECAYREQLLIREILRKCDLPQNFDGDADGDGYLDSLVIITDSSETTSQNELLWSHMSICHNFSESVLDNYYFEPSERGYLQSIGDAVLGRTKVARYNLIPAGVLCSRTAGEYSNKVKEDERHLYDIGLLCHETAHSIGLSDYYSYEDSAYESVGEFDLLGNKTNVVPQYMLTYLRQKAGWLGYDNLLYVNDSGSYTLYPVASDNKIKAVKIVLSDYLTTGEYFMAEVRSREFAHEENPFDGYLSGSGLIIYRVNEANAYINSLGSAGTTDYGNMYGADEVYVYRVGNGKSTTDVTGLITRSIFGDKLPAYTNSFGDSDLSKTVKDISSDGKMISYTDGKNSGIVFSDITINDDHSVTFNITLPEEQKNALVTKCEEGYIAKYVDGKNHVFWKSNVKSGSAHVLVLRSTERLKKLAENSKSQITFDDIKKGSFSYYKTLYSGVIPLAEKNAPLPDFSEEALVFLALEGENGACAIRYIGCIENANETFSQYALKILDPLYMLFAGAAVLMLVAVIVLIFTAKKNATKNKKNGIKYR